MLIKNRQYTTWSFNVRMFPHSCVLGFLSHHITQFCTTVTAWWCLFTLWPDSQSWATEAMKWCDEAFNASSNHCLNFLPKLRFQHFIASRICLHCLNAVTKKLLMHRSDEAMIPLAISKKIHYFRSFHSKAEKHCRLCLYICVLPCFVAISA